MAGLAGSSGLVLPRFSSGLFRGDCCINHLIQDLYHNLLFSCSQTKQLTNEGDFPSHSRLSCLNVSVLDRSDGFHPL